MNIFKSKSKDTDTYAQALECLSTKNFDKAIKLLSTAAKKGSADAALELANFYDLGFYQTRSFPDAMKWLEVASSLGCGKADAILGTIHLLGFEQEKQGEKAIKYFKSAAEKNEPYAQFLLYTKKIHENKEVAEEAKKKLEELAVTGNGRDMWRLARLYYKKKIPCGEKDAYDLFLKGALLGYAPAQNNVGLCIDNERGVPKDGKAAFDWYTKSAAQGYPVAYYNLGICYHFGSGVDGVNIPKTIENYEIAANKGYRGAMCNLGYLYTEDDPNPKKCYYWYKKASEQEYKDGLNGLGICYESGKGTKTNLAEAAKCYERAALKRSASGASNLYRMYRYGRGLPKSKLLAVKWAKLSIEYGDPGCNALLSHLLGKGADESTPEAIRYLKIGLEEKLDYAAFTLGSIYENGTGVPTDKQKALKYYKMEPEDSIEGLADIIQELETELNKQ